MTEEEAKTKWCPHSRANNGNETAGVNRYRAAHDPECMCVASICMAWRWLAIPNPDYKPGNYQVWPAQQPVGEPWIQSDTQGFCGLAGKP